jgi:hypothetical protein
VQVLGIPGRAHPDCVSVSSTDPSQAVIAYHYCTHLRPNLHQCIIYDSDGPDAKLIGIEYVVPKETFELFDDEEKKVGPAAGFQLVLADGFAVVLALAQV